MEDGWSTGWVCMYAKTVQLKSGKRSLYGSGPCRPYEDMSFSAYRSYLQGRNPSVLFREKRGEGV